MALICGKWRMYLGICLIVWETAKICGGNDIDLWQMAQIIMWGNDLIIWQTA